MKFETLKQNILHEFRTKFNYSNGETLYTNAKLMALFSALFSGKGQQAASKEILEGCTNLILSMDIRNLNEFDMFDCIPKWVKENKYTPELTDMGWELIKK